MRDIKSGDLVMCYDESGNMISLVIFLEFCRPFTLSREDVKEPNLWHYKVVMPDGMTRFLSTFCFTLQKID